MVCKRKGNQYTGNISALVKSPKVCVTRTAQNWVFGNYNGLEFQAQIFSAPSKFGIENGRVSKLVANSPRGYVIHYDRGWSKKPRSQKGKAFLKIIKKLG